MYVICYPQGGWNDMMSRIWYCQEYCMKTKRKLIIDTTKNWFRDDIYHYVNFTLPNLLKPKNQSEFITSLYKTESVFPAEMKGLDNENIPPIIWKAPGHMETSTGIIVSTRLDQLYKENVIVYADCGSSININPILCYTKFLPFVLNCVKERYESLPKGYSSVHIRNTDYKSDLDSFINKNNFTFSNTALFVASDNYKTIDLFINKYGAYSFSNIPKVSEGSNIHESQESQELRKSIENIREFNRDTIADFLLLAAGSTFYFSSKQSGFSRSIFYLNQERGLVKWLLPFV